MTGSRRSRVLTPNSESFREPEHSRALHLTFKLTKRAKLNLDIFWLKDESLEDSAIKLEGDRENGVARRGNGVVVAATCIVVGEDRDHR